MSELASLSAIVHGRVQGVFFRAFVHQHAIALGLTGYVRNLPGGRAIEVRAEGERVKLEELLQHLKSGPPGARVEGVEVDWSQGRGDFPQFEVRY